MSIILNVYVHTGSYSGMATLEESSLFHSNYSDNFLHVEKVTISRVVKKNFFPCKLSTFDTEILEP